jgi:membrane protein YqaA with SNARE-associated domain
MHLILQHLAHFFIALGGWGLLILGTLDSSFLFFPLGNDLLMVLLTTRHHEFMPYYAAMATMGSVIGCFITESAARKGGEAGLKGRVSERRLAYVQRQVTKRGAVMLAVASLMPPPFPFTVFVMAAAALRYPRARLLGIIAGARLTRFLLEGLLAIHYGRDLIRMSQSKGFESIVLAFVVICIAGSAWSVVSWVRSSRSSRSRA